MSKYLRIATSQFPVSHNMGENFEHIKMLSTDAAEQSADVIHFPETALPGYRNFPQGNPDGFDWDTFDALTEAVCDLARDNNIWIILGTIRQVEGQLPRNSIIVISDSGKIVGYYDKQRLYGSEKDVYSAGDCPFVATIKGHKCGFLICYDNCYPELYARYRELGIELLFHSIHNAGNKHETSMKNLIFANLLIRSADHQMWISASNSSTAYSPMPAAIGRPDGSYQMAERHSACFIIEDYPKAELGWTYNNTEF